MARMTVGPMGYDVITHFGGINIYELTVTRTNDATTISGGTDPRYRIQTATELIWNFSSGHQEILNGSFELHPGPTGSGMISRYRLLKDGETVIEVSDLSFPTTQAQYGSNPPGYVQMYARVLTGADTITASEADDRLTGFAGDDTIFGLGGADTLYGDVGDDLIYGNMGEDGIRGHDGADTIFGGKQFDSLWGEAGDDVVNGNMGDDVVVGGEGNNTLYGGQDNDLLWGESGSDHLYGDKGNDTLRGGAGADMFYLQAEGGTDYITDFNYAEGDRIIVAAGMSYAVGTDNGLHLMLSDGSAIYLVGHTSPSSLAGGWVVTG